MSSIPGEVSPSPKHYQDTMPKLDMELNSRLYIKINPLDKEVRPMQGEFLGISHFDFLILKIPSMPGLLPRLLPRTMIEVRFMQAGAVNTFLTEIITHTVKPAFLLYTTYPDRLSILEMRRHLRNFCSLPIFINTPHGGALGIISDLSTGGCRVILELKGQSTMRKLEVGDQLLLQTVFSANGKPNNGGGAVRNVESSGSRLIIGISFNTDEPEFTAALKDYLELARLLV